jgi:hypothetical protein
MTLSTVHIKVFRNREFCNSRYKISGRLSNEPYAVNIRYKDKEG